MHQRSISYTMSPYQYITPSPSPTKPKQATARLAGAMLAHPGHAGVQHFALSCLQVCMCVCACVWIKICIWMCIYVCLRGGGLAALRSLLPPGACVNVSWDCIQPNKTSQNTRGTSPKSPPTPPTNLTKPSHKSQLNTSTHQQTNKNKTEPGGGRGRRPPGAANRSGHPPPRRPRPGLPPPRRRCRECRAGPGGIAGGGGG